jgi:hypothetical protein
MVGDLDEMNGKSVKWTINQTGTNGVYVLIFVDW